MRLLKGQVARLVAVGQATQELIAASSHFTKAAEVTDRPWPDQRSIILYLDRPEQCKNPLLGDYFEATVAYVRERIEGAPIAEMSLDDLHRLIDEVQTDLGGVHERIRTAWFTVERPIARQSQAG